MKKLFALLSIFFALNVSFGQSKSIEVLKGESWWGGMTALGSKAPFGPSLGKVNFTKSNLNNQSTGFLVSNAGRYIFSTNVFDLEFDGKTLKLTGDGVDTIEVRKVGKTLRQAYMAAAQRHFKTDGKVPPKEFFTKPQYNTWIELNYNQTQKGVEDYADAILANGLPAGIIMIDDSWQSYQGCWTFRGERFENPKAMIDKLHQEGFKVMVWISPFVSPDSHEATLLNRTNYLIKDKNGRPALINWWNGTSNCYDFTNPEAKAYFVDYLKGIQAKYGVDGFKFDAGDIHFYTPLTQSYYKADAVPTDHMLAWSEIGLAFPYNEYRATWNSQGHPLVQRLGDKDYSWKALSSLIPEMINAGLCGYAFTCPDMIGGGQWGSFENLDQNTIDQDLIVRSAQVHALMPMMQFSVAPWRILDKEHMDAIKKVVKIRSEFIDHIYKEAENSAKTGEPIIRNMEYNYALKGFSDCKDQFAIGEELIVAPILNKEGTRTVRLPRGKWADDLGVIHRGPRVIEINAPIDRLPYFKLVK